MLAQGKIQKWGNSAGLRISAKQLAVAGMDLGSDIDIQADDGRLVIQLHERTKEQMFDKLLAEEEGMSELLKMVKDSLANAIETTDSTTSNIMALVEKLDKAGIQ
jgi:antitoxin component of MazEF toxin-antitoxin module